MARILVTDDSSFMRRRVCAILQAPGHQPREAADGNACLEAIAAEMPDALFLDLVMPEMDGFEVLDTLQQADYHLPVIVLTADIQESVKAQCLQLGATAFLNKPPAADQLLAALDTALAGGNGQ